MAGSRAMKAMCMNQKVSGKKEKAITPKTKQYQQTGPKHTGPNYPQWNFGSGKGETIKEEMIEGE